MEIKTEKGLKLVNNNAFNSIDQTITTKRFIRLRCVKERNGENIHEGETVYGDITSLWIDTDGDSYMMVSDAFGTYLGLKKLSRFRRIE